MNFYIFVFSSRNESTAFFNTLKSRGLRVNLIATPKDCMIGCGLSVKVHSSEYNLALRIFENFSYRYTFRGIFMEETRGMSKRIQRVR